MTKPDEAPPQPTPLRDLEVAEAEPYDKQFWSVTTILKVLDSPGLTYWAIKEAAEAALDNPATVKAMLDEQGRAEAVKWLCAARWRRPAYTLKNSELGTVVHALCEDAALSGFAPSREDIEAYVRKYATKTTDIQTESDLVERMVGHWLRWLDKFQPVFEAAEGVVYSETYGYAGCLDAIFSVQGVKLMADWKTRREPLTSKGGPQRPYAETGLQLAAYRNADIMATWRARRTEKYGRRYYLLGDDERVLSEPVPEVDHGCCVIITPEDCRAYPMNCNEEIYQYFLHCVEIFRFEDEISRRIVGDPFEIGDPSEILR
jgi:hypothetical protein